MAEVKRRTLSREDARVQMLHKVQVVFLSPERCFVITARACWEQRWTLNATATIVLFHHPSSPSSRPS